MVDRKHLSIPPKTSGSKQSASRQRVIGITGGIGTGKTTVSDYLQTTYHLPVLDADLYAREAVMPGSPILSAIAERYGTGVLRSNGELDRQRLGEIIFSSAAERLWLEQQIHPYVRDRLESAIQTDALRAAPVIVMVIPLLFEARMTDLVNEIWVVYCSPEQQLERLVQRDRLPLSQAQARMNSQMAIQKKTARATVVLDNSSTLGNLLAQIDRALMGEAQTLIAPHT